MNKKGFTLVELVVAIAALALCSGFILSMYFTSDELSDDANMYDEAMSQISFMAETFKVSDSPVQFARSIHLDQQELAETGQGSWTVYFNEDWYAQESLDNSYIVLFIELTPEKTYDSGSLYKLKLDFLKTGGQQEKIISLVSKKYFAGGVK